MARLRCFVFTDDDDDERSQDFLRVGVRWYAETRISLQE